MKRYFKIFLRSLTTDNPTFGLILGLCPTLAISSSLNNALGMSGAVLFVLVFSNIIISTLRKLIPSQIRLPAYIVIIATFVTICELIMKAYFPALDNTLGIYVPLIVVNCIILG
ncbi:MAG: electron transport complex subunit RsxE, partial [Candidatus Omnitrophica bacterium]|nr:electron transport complex subunit RsxE [Candidatus Omnitrophota bacterium]